MTQRYRLADPMARVPMPERGTGVMFSSSSEGEALDPVNPWHARLIAEGSVVHVARDAAGDQSVADNAPTPSFAALKSTPSKGA